jgi:hypothetical protein
MSSAGTIKYHYDVRTIPTLPDKVERSVMKTWMIIVRYFNHSIPFSVPSKEQ